jgi:hypothetical protein
MALRSGHVGEMLFGWIDFRLSQILANHIVFVFL